MTESLIRLLLRLSEAGEPAILWGRLAKPHLGRRFERLLDRGILIEDAPATEWSTCASCECGLDARPIQLIDGRPVATCPLDRTSDLLLDAEDLRSFRIATGALVREIAAASGFADQPSEVLPGVWHLGLMPAKQLVFLAPSIAATLQPGLIASLRMVGHSAPTILIAPKLPVSEQLRFEQAGVHIAVVREIIGAPGDAAPFALDMLELVSAGRGEPRLVLVRARQTIILDGSECRLPPRPFELLWLLAEAVVAGRGVVTRREIEQRLWGKQVVAKIAANDATRDLRQHLASLGTPVSGNADLIETRHGRGYVLALPADAIRLLP